MWNNHVRGTIVKLQRKKKFLIRHFSVFIFCATLVDAFNFAPAFLHIFLIRFSKRSFQPILIPNGYSYLLLFLWIIRKFNSTVLSVLITKWHSSSLPFTWLLLNQLKKDWLIVLMTSTHILNFYHRFMVLCHLHSWLCAYL